MRKIISFANHKGGVGKTTSAVSIAAALAEEGKNVLLVDIDPLGSATLFLGIESDGSALLEALQKTAPLPVTSTAVKGLDLVASGPRLGEARRRFTYSIGSELLGKSLNATEGPWEWIMLDCPPGVDVLTLSALKASRTVLIPAEANHLGLHGLNQMLADLKSSHSEIPFIEVVGIIPCRAQPRRRMHGEIMKRFEELFPNKVTPIIRENVSLAEAPGAGRPVTLHARTSHGAHDYRTVAKWLLDRNGEVIVF